MLLPSVARAECDRDAVAWARAAVSERPVDASTRLTVALARHGGFAIALLPA